MSVGDGLRKAAAGAAGVALATAGLSSCKNGNGGGLGAVDPPPPPLQCNSVNNGQTLVGTASIRGDSAVVEIRHGGFPGVWRGPRITAVTGGSIGRITTPSDGTLAPFVVAFPFGALQSLSVSFTFEGSLTDDAGTVCPFRRTFILTATRTSATVAQITLDALPLPARQRAEIVVVAQAGGGRSVTLEARTPYRGAHQRTWEVSAGVLSDLSAERVTWTLPEAPGIYSVELALDYGEDGMAFDAVMMEVGEG